MTSLDKKRELMTALSNYRRWQREGERTYGYGSGNQLYYDSYHAGVKPEGEGVFSFRIQLEDSPDGDYWWSGKFKTLNGETDVELLEEKGEWR